MCSAFCLVTGSCRSPFLITDASEQCKPLAIRKPLKAKKMKTRIAPDAFSKMTDAQRRAIISKPSILDVKQLTFQMEGRELLLLVVWK